MKKKIIAHAHIFKNAGSTIDWILRRNFSERFYDNREDFKMRTDPSYLLEFLLSKPDLEAFSSHSLPLPIREHSKFDFYTVAMLRHPLLRVKSVYDFERKQPGDTPGAINAKKLTFAEYVKWRMRDDVAPTIRNMHVRYLTANSHQRIENLTESHYDGALQFVLENRLVGVVEDFDKSMVIFSDYLSENDINVDFAYRKQNESRNKEDSVSVQSLCESLGDELYQILVQKNEMDIRLYDSVSEVVNKRFNSIHEREVKLNKLQNSSIALA